MHELSGKNGSLTAAANSKLAKQHRARGKPYRPPTMKADACRSPWDGCPTPLDGNPLATDGHPPVRDGYSLPMGAHSLIPFAYSMGTIRRAIKSITILVLTGG